MLLVDSTLRDPAFEVPVIARPVHRRGVSLPHTVSFHTRPEPHVL